jgi:acyl carrier protein
MRREDILEGLKKVLTPYTPHKEALDTITSETDFIKDLKINSANMVDILIEAEEEYNIEIDMDSAEKIHNVGSCIDVIIEKINETK